MALDTKPKRQRLEYPQVAAAEGSTDHQAVGDNPGAALPPADPPESNTSGGPSWWQFLIFQTLLLLGAVLLFGILAFALISRLPAPSEGAAAAPAASPSGAASAAPSQAASPAASAAGTPVPATANRLGTPAIANPVGTRGAQTVKVDLEAQEVVGLLDDGIAYEYWTFNGTVPGPMIRVRQGDTIELTLKSAETNKVAHSIDLHALIGPGGGSESTAVAPGQSKTVKFQATQAGVFVYQSGSSPQDQQLSSGMYGLIVVEPPQGLPKVDREYYVMQGEFYLTGKREDHGQRAFSADKAAIGQPDYVVFNGAVNAIDGANAMKMQTGETIRIFFGVGGPNHSSNLRVVGELFERVAAEGTPLSDPTKWATGVQSTMVPIGGAAVVEIRADVPGRYTIVDAGASNAQKGAVGYLIIEGPENPAIYSPQR